jgi:DNA-binding NarL/FixJ family response regulator
MNKRINIAVVDDHAMFREGIVGLLKEFPEIRITFQASSGKDLLDQLKKHEPEIILLDIEMPEMDGIDATIEVRKKYPHIKIIILTMHTEEELIYDLLKKGANGFLPKDKSVENLVDAIYNVLEKNYYFNEQITKAMALGINGENNKQLAMQKAALSDREIEIIRLLCREYSNKEIAKAVFLSERTVEKHKENIYIKTQSKSAYGIILFALKHGLIQ